MLDWSLPWVTEVVAVKSQRLARPLLSADANVWNLPKVEPTDDD